MNVVECSIRRTFAIAGAVLVGLTAAGTAARAQDAEPAAARQWAVKVGCFLPQQGVIKTQTGETWWNLGLDYAPAFRYEPAGGKVSFGVDLAFREVGSKQVFAMPLLVKLIWPIAPVGGNARVYGGIGAGPYVINTPHIGATIQPGLQLVGGVDLNSRWFVEATYDWVAGYTDNLGLGNRVDGVKASLGYRF